MLDQLPAEVLLLIFTFLPAKTVLGSVTLVCKKFHELLSEEWVWRNRFQRGCGYYPLVISLPHSLRHVQQACMDGDFVACAREHTLKAMPLHASTGGVDCVHLTHHNVSGVGKMVAAGSRDHLVYVWKLREQTGDEEPKEGARAMRPYTTTQLSKHRGWVWCLASHSSTPNILMSGGWDATILAWDIANGVSISRVNDGTDRGAVLDLAYLDSGHLVSAWGNKQVRVYDQRQGSFTSSVVGSHARAVLSVATSDHLIFSAGEDRTVMVWDNRSPGQELFKLKHKASVTSLCLSDRLLSCSSGLEAFLYTTNGGHLSLIKHFPTKHRSMITSVFHNHAMLVTGSKDRTVEVHAMNEKEEEECIQDIEGEENGDQGDSNSIYSITNHQGDICCIDFQYNTLALASADRTVSLWTPTRFWN